MEFVGSEVVRVVDIVHPNQSWVKFSNIKFLYGSVDVIQIYCGFLSHSTHCRFSGHMRVHYLKLNVPRPASITKGPHL